MAQDPATGRFLVQLQGENAKLNISSDNLQLEEEPRAGPSQVGPALSLASGRAQRRRRRRRRRLRSSHLTCAPSSKMDPSANETRSAQRS